MPESVNKTCQNCTKEFIIESDDFVFYDKINVPPPTFCPKCRLVRRMNNTNERVLYSRKCDLTGKTIFSMFPAEAPFPVYNVDDWYGDGWDPYAYGMEYDFNKSFFEQFLELQNKVPRMALVRQGKSVNSEYCHRVDSPKNSYMVFRATQPEDCAYLYVAMYTRDCIDSSYLTKCELCYECIDCENGYKLIYSQESVNCRDSSFLYSCYNCSNCVGCVNLRNAEFCIENVQYSKEEYLEKIKELNLHTRSGLDAYEKHFDAFRKQHPQRATTSLKVDHVSGNWLTNCQNVKNSFGCFNVKDGKHLFVVFDAQDCMDYFQWGNKAELVYESENCGIQVSRLFSCSQCWMGAHDLEYCDSCPGAGYCFGCIGLKKGEYSILNKRYEKDEYFAMLEKIKLQMKEFPFEGKNGRVYSYGEHFPLELAPFAYNETAAQDFFPLNKEEALAQGYEWKDRQKNTYTPTFKSNDLPDTIAEVSDTIKNEIIECGDKDKEYSIGAYKISEQELLFYRKMNLPLPRFCFNVRFTNRFNKRPNMELIERSCNKCNALVSTVYTADNAPILYCEECYRQAFL